jgi:hypothetical protein
MVFRTARHAESTEQIMTVGKRINDDAMTKPVDSSAITGAGCESEKRKGGTVAGAALSDPTLMTQGRT